MTRYIGLTVLLVSLAGCLPIELDVSRDGRILIPRQEGFFILDPATGQVTRVAQAKAGQPSFARFADGGNILAVANTSANNMQFRLINPASGQDRQVFSASNCTYVTFSPAGKQFAVARVADSKSGNFDQNLPELLLIDAASGTRKKLASNVSSLHHWSADGKALYTVQLQSKDEDKDLYIGQLVRIDIATGKAKALCKLAGPDSMFMDISPDGKTALLTASNAAAMSENLDVPNKDDLALFKVDLAGDNVRRLRNDILYAIFSPDGKQVLIGAEGEDNLATLQVVDAAFSRIVTIAEDAAAQASGGMGPTTHIYPGWVNNTTVHYLARRNAYGVAGKNLMLMICSSDGKTSRCLQAAVDAAAMK